MPQALRNAAQFVGESLAKPVTDEVGKIVETGVQSITGSQKPLDPDEEAKKKAEEQKKLAVAQGNVNRLIESENRYRQQKAIELQRQNQEAKDEQEEKQIQQIEVQENQDSMTKAQMLEKTRAETGRNNIGG